jgi:hypothetical protein
MSATQRRHISTFRGYRIVFSIRNPYINRFTNHFSIHSLPSYHQKVVLHSITARFCLRPSFRNVDFHFRTYKRDLAILTEWWQQRIAWWELLIAACHIICIRKQQHRYKARSAGIGFYFISETLILIASPIIFFFIHNHLTLRKWWYIRLQHDFPLDPHCSYDTIKPPPPCTIKMSSIYN